MDSYAKFISTLAAALATAESPRALKKPRRGQHAGKNIAPDSENTGKKAESSDFPRK